jgi:hypothetical protein
MLVLRSELAQVRSLLDRIIAAVSALLFVPPCCFAFSRPNRWGLLVPGRDNG